MTVLTLAPQRAIEIDNAASTAATAPEPAHQCGTCNDAGYLKPASKVDGNVITLDVVICPQLALEIEADLMEALDELEEFDWVA